METPGPKGLRINDIDLCVKVLEMYIILQELLLFFRYDVHEKEVGKIALEMGFEQVSLSSTIMPMVRVVPRGYTGKLNILIW